MPFNRQVVYRARLVAYKERLLEDSKTVTQRPSFTASGNHPIHAQGAPQTSSDNRTVRNGAGEHFESFSSTSMVGNVAGSGLTDSTKIILALGTILVIWVVVAAK